MPLRPNMEPREYVDILLRRKWLIIYSFLIIMFGGIVYCVVARDQYKSSTTILLIPQRVPENYVRSTVSVRMEDRLATIQQQVMSRTRLLTVMEELGLFKEERKKSPLESVVNIMQKRIELQVRRTDDRGGDARGNDAITLSFIHEDPRIAMLATSRLASLFIDENLKTREQQAVGTSEFLESQLRDTKTRLAEQEEKVKQYKMAFMGELPQQMDANLNMLRGLQDQFRANSDGIRAAEDRKVFLEAQVGPLERMTRTVVVNDNGDVERVTVHDPTQNLLTELATRRAQLAELTARYTDRYPEVTRIRREVEQLEKRVAEPGQNSSASTVNNGHRPAMRASRTTSPPLDSRQSEDLMRLRAQITAADAEIASLKKERGEIQKNMAAVQDKIGRSPRREQEMIALTRDYENLKLSYDDLLKKKLEADISQNLERRQKGEQFQILDPANLPEEPFKPERKKVMGLALAIALGLGFGGAICLEMIDPTLRGRSDFKHFFQIPVLACIPVIQNHQYKRSRTLRRAGILGGLVAIGMLLSLFLLVYSDKVRTLLKF